MIRHDPERTPAQDASMNFEWLGGTEAGNNARRSVGRVKF